MDITQDETQMQASKQSCMPSKPIYIQNRLLVQHSRELLGELESAFPKVFDEPQYPITANRTPFTIELVDPALPPKRRKLYPMSSLELDELRT